VVQQVRELAPVDLDRFKSVLRQILNPDSHGRIAFPAWANAVKGRVAA
jgi:hypothetical protein